ncbi:restriction endonuclease subunit S [Kamptonema sp. UHCC 0994]|uniref:DUF6943 family protein n=1 Tax=Kamptonema sp. UHCC 0994 TaxID=3031329 RepID=UPI0023B9BF48|nr:restriction endonuclease subunit S [Kamptonema sp. UHCC 0994]MDF0553262.1 restriction endonuclease subunit S [Kamptonema sp. UHCC 0994]
MNSSFNYSGVHWLGEVPSNWSVIALKRYASYISRGRSPDYTDDKEKGIPIINQACIYWDGLRLGNIKLQNPDVVNGYGGKLYPGDLLINSTGTGTLGRMGVFNLDDEYLADSHVTIVRPTKEIYTQYLYYLLQTNVYQGYIYSVLASGATNQIELSREGLSNIPIIVPPREQQELIAAFLDRKTAAIDTLIAKKQRLIQLLEEKRTALLNQAVTKGLNPNVPMKDSGIPWMGEIPEHWSVKRLKFVCKLETGHTPSKSEPTYWIPEECNIPWVSLNDTKTLEANDFIEDTKLKISQIGIANSSAYLINAGAVVFNRDGARVGLCAITTKTMAVSQHIIAWVCQSEVNNYFILHVMYAMKSDLRRLTAGSTIPTIGMDDVKSMASPIPPLHEQHEIVNYLIQNRNKIERIISQIKQQIKKLQEYRYSLITAAVTGQLDIGEEDAA